MAATPTCCANDRWRREATVTLSDETVAAYRRDGVVVLRQVFGAEWIDQLRAGLDRNIAAPGPYHRVYTGAD